MKDIDVLIEALPYIKKFHDKKILIKYGIIFACLFPVLIVLNYFLNQVLNFWITVVIDCVVVLFVLFVLFV